MPPELLETVGESELLVAGVRNSLNERSLLGHRVFESTKFGEDTGEVVQCTEVVGAVSQGNLEPVCGRLELAEPQREHAERITSAASQPIQSVSHRAVISF